MLSIFAIFINGSYLKRVIIFLCQHNGVYATTFIITSRFWVLEITVSRCIYLSGTIAIGIAEHTAL